MCQHRLVYPVRRRAEATIPAGEQEVTAGRQVAHTLAIEFLRPPPS